MIASYMLYLLLVGWKSNMVTQFLNAAMTTHTTFLLETLIIFIDVAGDIKIAPSGPFAKADFIATLRREIQNLIG